MDDLSLDPAVLDEQLAGARDRKPVSAWHRRRLFGFGASDVPALMVGLGLRDASTVPAHVAANANLIRVVVPGEAATMWPRICVEKSGRKAALKAGRAADVGTVRERELLEAWRASLRSSDIIDPESVTHASIVPRELQAAVRDPECPLLAASLDGWARDVLGELVVIEAKCGNKWRDALPWYWRAQVLAQLACTELDLGLVVCGQQWSRGLDVRGPIDVWPVERDEAAIAEIREAVRAGWRLVEALRGGA
jgi:hypothetical protein